MRKRGVLVVRAKEVPVVTQADISTGLRELGLRPGDSVLVHSSLSSFGYVVNGADAVIDALLEVVEGTGNVIVPTLTGTAEDGPDRPPVFDVRHAPCWTGRIPSVLMKRSEAKRSLHPTHSVAGIGPQVAVLEEGHEDCLTPCGELSPYYRLAVHGGYILLMGVDQESNTTIHTAEELAEVPYHMQKRTTETVVIDHRGIRHVKPMLLHDWGTPRDFQRIDDQLLSLGIMKTGVIGNCTIRLIHSLSMIEWLVNILRKDPQYLCK